ncbi:MAG TPA: ABC transporter ATP-binding protein [Anaerolineales bacterium]|nr:ABC transporter ATP-binding protein [Anaerolineales bacterium]
MISVESLTKIYGRRHAVDNIDFHADRGEIVGFLGPNGAGKTTTMRILSGFMPPTSGKATVGGFDVVEQSLEVRKRVGYLPETVPLYTDMTVFEYLAYMGNLHKVDDVEDKVEDVLEMVNMESRVDSYISSLSKGMRQRIGLAQALIHNPDVLILDEPTIGLDPAQIIEIRTLIRGLGAEHTVLLSTHILSEVQQLCDRILVINKGKIVAEGTPKNLEQRLAGAGRVSLQVSGRTDGLVDLVGRVKGVESVLLAEEGRLEFLTAPGVESRPEVSRAIVNAGYDLIEIRSVGMSLEEIFLELTADDPLRNSEEPQSPKGETDDEDEE